MRNAFTTDETEARHKTGHTNDTNDTSLTATPTAANSDAFCNKSHRRHAFFIATTTTIEKRTVLCWRLCKRQAIDCPIYFYIFLLPLHYVTLVWRRRRKTFGAHIVTASATRCNRCKTRIAQVWKLDDEQQNTHFIVIYSIKVLLFFWHFAASKWFSL